ncbi:SusC/RagA family TonB-linked outer membrane protein [Arachidicoccus ginsenosidimutans]|uniref:SusC/RagA family TonB-linked outer membrane protein n=1 Tax=Arachidicoccus sp. BS20 TaxID=1850526 RepID=UPI001E381F86|nr:TonB-dependent receptor [Arachidicoccus sp. BS20]
MLSRSAKPNIWIFGLFAIILFLGGIKQSSAQSTSSGQQLITVTGSVKDTTGKILSGVSIVNTSKKGSGTFTDDNGNFIIEVSAGSVLQFSFVGFQSQNVTVSEGMKPLNIILHPATAESQDVVVTAFGRTERKEAVVGSVTSVNPQDLQIPASNLTTALAGRVAGMIAFQRGGQPGFDNANFFIRGVTTNGYSASPLILVDNIELSADDLARLQVDDIASFSILKDASAAALYGARGANGVILITTKDGKIGKASVNIRVENSVSKPTKTIKLADPVTYMKDYNEAVTTRFPSQTPQFTPNQIYNTQQTWDNAPGSSPYIYPAVDWMKTLFKDQTATRRADFNASGGSQFAKYYIAGSYSRDNGILQVSPINNFNSGMKYENYQLRANVNLAITSTTNVEVRLWGNFNDYTGPITSSSDGFATDLYSKALHANPVAFAPSYPPDSANLLTHHILFGNNTNITGGLLDNPYADLMDGYKSFSQSRMSAQFELTQKFDFFTKGLSFHGIFSTNRYSYFDLTRQYKPFYYNIASFDPHTNDYTLDWINNQPGQAQEFLSYYPGTKTVTTYLYLQGTLDYTRNFGKNNVSATLIGTREQTEDGDAGDLQSSLPNRNLGFSGRASYSYDNRYFVEFNFGYNGSEKFAPQHRWGFFPTIGAGWVISNEKFWTGGISDVITRLKLRGSYGLVGNDNISSRRFFYLSNVSPDGGPGASFGTSNGFSLNGTTISAYPNPDITWERSKKSNLAIEATFFKNLNVTAEIYHEYRYDILNPRGYIPVSVGLETSANANLQANIGKVKSNGLDLNLDYKQTISKDFWAQAMGNLTVTSNKLIYDEEPDYRYAYQYGYGLPLNQPRGYIAERLFVDDKEALNSPPQAFGGSLKVMGGDIKYRDVNGDGVIDGDDQVPIGLPTTPQIIYGFGFSVGYKHFDLSAFFQGLARESFFIDQNSTAPFINNSQLLQAYADNHWTEENQNLYALWPRFSSVDIPNNDQTSTWWLRDGSFLRLKSAEFGYTLPQKWTKHAAIKNLRIYFSGLNLLTFSKFKMWDPEQAGNGFGYPIQKVYNLGLNMNF